MPTYAYECRDGERTFPLSEAAEANQSLESRKTTGKILLIPPGNSKP